MNIEVEAIVAAIKKSFAEFNEKFREPKEKTVQILKQFGHKKSDPKQTEQKTYTGPSWYPEEKIYQLKKQAEAEQLDAALNSMTDSQFAEVVKAVSKQPLANPNLDCWYKERTGIFI